MRKYAWIYILIALIAVIWGVRFFMNQPVQTEIATAISYEDKVEAAGVLVRYETVYQSAAGGSLQPQVADEARVAKGKKIATVYTDGIDGNLKVDLDNVNEKIAIISSNIPHASGHILAERFCVIGTLRSNFLLHKKRRPLRLRNDPLFTT